mmetsp:Transcript_14056/g.42431  ORF Transcript_14056/g.42431 Transcript_14056/m.42431 type:complete len:238 (-) Transcript_14056:158-871(-)
MDRAGARHPRAAPTTSSFPVRASTGSAARCCPRGVRRSSSVRAPTARSVRNAASTAAGGGGWGTEARKKAAGPSRSTWICSTSSSSGTRTISGAWKGRMLSKRSRVYSAKHIPGRTRPARPARCLAAAWDTKSSTRALMPRAALWRRSFSLPASTTYTTSAIVRLVSAMLVAKTTLRTPGGGVAKTRRCWSPATLLCSGSSHAASPGVRKRGVAASASCALRISAMPGRNTRMAPSP